MPAKRRRPQATLHVSVFVPTGDLSTPPDIYHSASLSLTPNRLNLLRRLVGDK
jgi:hypothetical protein